ncbi:hypothetical protein [Ruania zhangjianzhongii]|uniref:hypothetical protein n=1 Tax=Ruania zhangjianzhongii TaxID=2603206 RepID=UPI0011CCB68F|nr:hypothetical protein [Ruania zhangjianzhongii]
MSSSADQETSRSRWGRVRFGRGRASAMAPAIPLGIGVAAVIGAVAALVGFAPESPWVGAFSLTFAMSGPMVALVWALCMDRSTLRGALDRPEESVESSWYDKATQGAFHDVLLVSGLALAALMITGTRVEGSVVLLGVLAVCLVSAGTRYVINRQRS